MLIYIYIIYTYISSYIYIYIILQVSGKLYAWGSNEYGQLGVSQRYMERHCSGPDAIGVCCNGKCSAPQRVDGACAGINWRQEAVIWREECRL